MLIHELISDQKNPKLQELQEHVNEIQLQASYTSKSLASVSHHKLTPTHEWIIRSQLRPETWMSLQTPKVWSRNPWSRIETYEGHSEELVLIPVCCFCRTWSQLVSAGLHLQQLPSYRVNESLSPESLFFFQGSEKIWEANFVSILKPTETLRTRHWNKLFHYNNDHCYYDIRILIIITVIIMQ